MSGVFYCIRSRLTETGPLVLSPVVSYPPILSRVQSTSQLLSVVTTIKTHCFEREANAVIFLNCFI